MAADVEPVRFAGHDFANQDLLAQAMTPRSAGVPHNERLEFLGDAVLGLIVAEPLYKGWPKADEGPLTRARAELVRESSLAHIPRTPDLGPTLQLRPDKVQYGGPSRDPNPSHT